MSFYANVLIRLGNLFLWEASLSNPGVPIDGAPHELAIVTA